MGVATMAAGAGLKAIGAYGDAKSQKSSLNFQANLDDLNAHQSELSAQSALAQGQMQEQSSDLRTANLKSTQRAGLAASGVDLGVGSAANILTSTDVMGQIDANTIAANAVRSAWGYRTQATNQQNDALMKRAGASAISPLTSAATSLLGSAGSVAQSWYSKNSVGSNSGTAASGNMGAMGDMGVTTAKILPMNFGY